MPVSESRNVATTDNRAAFDRLAVRAINEGLPPEIASKILPNAVTGCWEWIGAKDSRGYGNVKIGGRVRKAHRGIYEFLRGQGPPNYQCDHPCRGPWCVNPDHVEGVAHAENVRRGAGPWVPGARQRAKRRGP